MLARGYHQRAGGPHAEIVALDALGRRAPGATMYVTLEPCCHTGRTGPCTERVLAAGIQRVVVGCKDENPLVAGRGISRLRRAGVQVVVGCLEQECRAANRGFFRWIGEGRPQVTLKAAASLDGFIAPRPARQAGATGMIHWVTGPAARQAAHQLRARHDAILVGAGTVIADDPRLTVRLPAATPRTGNGDGRGGGSRVSGTGHFPLLRVVLDGQLRTPPGARLFAERGTPPPLVVTAQPRRLSPTEQRARARRERALRKAGAEVVTLPAGRDGQVPLPSLLAELGRRQIQSLLVEGGSRVHGGFIAARLVDEVAIFLAPRLQGDGIPLAAGPALPWAAPLRLGPLRVEPLGSDILLRADIIVGRRQQPHPDRR